MPWQYTGPISARDIPSLLNDFKRVFGRLSQVVMCYERVPSLVYGTTVTPGGNVSQVQLITVTNGVAFTIANPLHPREGAIITLDIYNNSGGVMGAITWGSQFNLGAAFTNPANGLHRIIQFYRTGAADAAAPQWREVSRGAADV